MKAKNFVLVATMFVAVFAMGVVSMSAQSAGGNVGSKKLSSKEAAKEKEMRKRLARQPKSTYTPARIKAEQEGETIVLRPVHQDVSATLDKLIENKRSFPTEVPRPMRDGRRELLEFDDPAIFSPGPLVESYLQTEVPLPSAAIAGTSFEGPGSGIAGYTVTAIPPDTTMAVGPNHVVAWVNSHFMIFNKTGVPQLAAPGFATGNTIWNGFGGLCETTNRGDPLVQYDRLADRWIFSQFCI